MANSGAERSDPELQKVFERWEHRKQLTPFWEEAEKDSLKELPPPPEAPNSRSFGLTEAMTRKLPGEGTTAYASVLLMVLIGIGLWICFQIKESFAASEALSEANRADLTAAFFLLAFILVIIYQPLLRPLEKYLKWVELSWWDKLHPGWRSYLDEKNRFEKQKAEFEKKKNDLISANAERRYSIALRKKEYWRKLSGTAFEIAMANLYRKMGYIVEMTPYTGDGGVDLILRKDGQLTVVQCKLIKLAFR